MQWALIQQGSSALSQNDIDSGDTGESSQTHAPAADKCHLTKRVDHVGESYMAELKRNKPRLPWVECQHQHL